MEQIVKKEFEDLFVRYPRLEVCRDDIRDAYVLMQKTYLNHHKVLIAGNGGRKELSGVKTSPVP